MLGGTPISGSAMTDFSGWIAAYQPDGSHRWSVGIVGPFIDSVRSIVVDSVGDVYLAGLSGGEVDFGGGKRTSPGAFLVKLSGTNGAYVWDRMLNMNPTGLAVMDSGAVVITGSFTGTADFGGGNHTAMGGRDYILAAYNSSTGAHKWSKPLPSTGDELDALCSIITVDGDVIAAGGFRGTATLGGTSLVSSGERDVFLARFRGTDGAHIWSIRYGGMSDDAANAVTTDGSHVFVAGQFIGMTNLGGSNLIASGGYDAFAAAYSAIDGTPVWSQHFGGMADDEALSIAVGPNHLAVTLHFTNTIRIGAQSFTASANVNPSDFNADIAIVRLDPERGDPSRAWHLPSTYGSMSLTYVGRQLAGNGTFAQTTTVFGTMLTSLDDGDVAAFRVDLDRVE